MGSSNASGEPPAHLKNTCPQLVWRNGHVVLVITTAIEHMPADRRKQSPEAGSLFVAPTPWTRLANPIQQRLQPHSHSHQEIRLTIIG